MNKCPYITSLFIILFSLSSCATPPKSSNRKTASADPIKGNETGNREINETINSYIKMCEEKGGVASFYSSQEKVQGLDSKLAFPVSLPAMWVGQVGFNSHVYFINKNTGETIASERNMIEYIAKELKVAPEQVDLRTPKMTKWLNENYGMYIFDITSDSYEEIESLNSAKVGKISAMKVDTKESCQLLRDELITWPALKESDEASFEFVKFNLNDKGLDYATEKFCGDYTNSTMPKAITDAFKELKSNDKEKDIINCAALHHLYKAHEKTALWFHMEPTISSKEILENYKKYINKSSLKVALKKFSSLRKEASSGNVNGLNSELNIGVNASSYGSFTITDRRMMKQLNTPFFSHRRDMFYDLYNQYATKKKATNTTYNDKVFVKLILYYSSADRRPGWNGMLSMYTDPEFTNSFAKGGELFFDERKEDFNGDKIVKLSDKENRYTIIRPSYDNNNTKEYYGKFANQQTSSPLAILHEDTIGTDRTNASVSLVHNLPTIGYFSFTRPDSGIQADLNGNICELLSESKTELKFSCPVNLRK